jgi:hypothetical protein
MPFFISQMVMVHDFINVQIFLGLNQFDGGFVSMASILRKLIFRVEYMSAGVTHVVDSLLTFRGSIVGRCQRFRSCSLLLREKFHNKFILWVKL